MFTYYYFLFVIKAVQMRYHIRKKAAIKIGLVVVAMIFILPFLISKLENSSSESDALLRRRKKVSTCSVKNID